MILNIRGTSGSGKTHTVRTFKDANAPELIIKDGDKILAHMVHYNLVPVYIIGKYVNVCGGCDTIHTQDEVCNLVRYFSQFGHVIFEGLLISHSFMRYYSLMQEFERISVPMVIARMDTPLEVCLERVKQRRLDKGNEKELNPQNTISTFNSCLGMDSKFAEVGVKIRLIKHKLDPVAQVASILEEDQGITRLHDINIVSKF